MPDILKKNSNTPRLLLVTLIPIKAKQPQLLGGDEKDKVKVTQLLGVIKDVSTEIGKICYSKKEDFEGLKAAGIEKVIHPKLKLLDKFLGNKEYLVGYVTVADVVLFYYLDLLNAMDAKILEPVAGLVGLHKRFSEIPKIKEYRASGRIPKGWNGWTASWGAPSV